VVERDSDEFTFAGGADLFAVLRSVRACQFFLALSFVADPEQNLFVGRFAAKLNRLGSLMAGRASELVNSDGDAKLSYNSECFLLALNLSFLVVEDAVDDVSHVVELLTHLLLAVVDAGVIALSVA
jgi:hypothetical protein